MKLEVQVSNIGPKNWNNDLLTNIHSTLYQTIEWANLYREAYDAMPIFISVYDPKDNLVGQMTASIWKHFSENIPRLEKILSNKLNLHKTLTWFYGPIIHEQSLSNEIRKAIFEQIDIFAKKNKVNMIRGMEYPSVSNVLPNSFFEEKNYSDQLWSTYITNLEITADDLFSSLNKKTRYDIRKSEKNNLVFDETSSLDSYNEFLELKYQSKIKAGRNAIRKPHYYHKSWEILGKNNFEKIFLVRHNGEPIAGIMALLFNKHMIQHAVVNSDKTELLGGTFAMWKTLEWGIKNHFSTFDVAGVNPNPHSKKRSRY